MYKEVSGSIKLLFFFNFSSYLHRVNGNRSPGTGPFHCLLVLHTKHEKNRKNPIHGTQNSAWGMRCVSFRPDCTWAHSKLAPDKVIR